MSNVDLVAEFERLRALVYASFWVTGLGLAVFLAAVVYFMVKVVRTNEVVRSYRLPWRVHLRVMYSLGSRWEALVDKAQVDTLRKRRRYYRRALAAILILMAFNSSIRLLRKQWLKRITAIGEAAATQVK